MKQMYSFYLVIKDKKIEIRSIEQVSEVYFDLYKNQLGEIKFLQGSKTVLESYILADDFHKAIDKMNAILNLLNDNFNLEKANGR